MPETGELFLYAVTSKVTSDCLADRLIQWWEAVKERFPDVTTLVINLDNGPECHSRRTQFMQRLVDFVRQYRISIRLAYYPPYHSKYNPIERCWGILESHWNGALLTSVKIALKWANTMTWRGVAPLVHLLDRAYETGVRLSPRLFRPIAARLERSASLPKWSLVIHPEP